MASEIVIMPSISRYTFPVASKTLPRKPVASAAAAAPVAANAIPKPPRRATSATLRIVPSDPAEQLRQYVDELGALEKELVEIRPKLRRVEVLHGLIRDRFRSHAATEAVEARGVRYGVTLGPRAFRSTVDYDAVRKAMGLEAYAKIAQPTLKALEATLAPDVVARVVTYDYTGARPVKTFEIAKGK